MTNEQFVDGIRQNIARVREYKLGMDGRGGQCDCIGLIIGAIRLMGGEWKGTHGSNYAARNEMRNFGEIISENVLSVGDLVYKAKKPGQSGYALPSTYNSHPDQRDYYHVGVVTSVKPLEITHCTGVSGGIKRDKTLGQWQYSGQLIKVDSVHTEYRIVTGGTLKMREGPGTTYKVIDYIPNNSKVTFLGDSGEEWSFVRYGGNNGYCMSKYLKKEGENGVTEADEYITIRIPLSVAEALQAALKQALEGGQAT